MNSLYRAIEQQKNKSGIEEWDRQTWGQFQTECCGKKVFIYGAGALLDMLLDRFMPDIPIEAIIDNNPDKQKMKVNDFSYYAKKREVVCPDIMGEEILKEYEKDKVAIIISSINQYQEIANHLQQLRVKRIYIALIMCAKEVEKVRPEEYTLDYDVAESLKKPVDFHKLIFRTMGNYSGHGRRIAEELLKRRKDLDIVWIVDHPVEEVPEGIRTISGRYNQKVYYEEMETAGWWIMEHPVPIRYLKKRELQIYIQIKHWSSVTLKSFGKTLHEFRNEQKAVDDWEENGTMMDYIFVGSPFDEETCRKGFCFDKEAIHVGSPRSDILFKEKEMKEKVYTKYNLKHDTHILLYAPTFRYDENHMNYGECKDVAELTHIDFESIKTALCSKTGGEWKILLRLHPMRNSLVKEADLPPYVHNVTDYQDGEELVAASDAMITDYSSIMFEPAFVRKPVFLYAPDRAEYIDKERSLLIDYDTLPFDIAETNEELVRKIEQFDKAAYDQRVDAFMQKYGVHEDGHATERAADFILKLMDQNEGKH